MEEGKDGIVKNAVRNGANVLNMQQGAVTVVDVLGWKGIWQRKSDAMEALRGIRDLIGHLQKSDLPGLAPEIWGFSDTIILTAYGEPGSVLPVHANMSSMALSFCLSDKLPARGAIGYGKFCCMDNMLIGPAVDEVFSWYEAVEWLGAVLTPTASFYYRPEDFRADNVIDYDVPLTGGGKYAMKCVDWLDDRKDEAELLQCFRDTASVMTPDVAPKYQNTIEFFRYVRKFKASKRAKAT